MKSAFDSCKSVRAGMRYFTLGEAAAAYRLARGSRPEREAREEDEGPSVRAEPASPAAGQSHRRPSGPKR